MLIALMILLFISIVTYSLDISTAPEGYYKSCEKNFRVQLLHLAHHFLSVFAHFAWLSNDKTILYIYFFVPLFALLHWATNGGNCKVSQVVNNVCKIDGTEFRQIFHIAQFHDYKYYRVIQALYILTAWIIAIQKIRNLP